MLQSPSGDAAHSSYDNLKPNADGSIELDFGTDCPRRLRDQLDPDRSGQGLVSDVSLLHPERGTVRRDVDAAGCRVDEITRIGDRKHGYDRNQHSQRSVRCRHSRPRRIATGHSEFPGRRPDAATAQKLFDELNYRPRRHGVHQRLRSREPARSAEGIQGRRLDDNEVLVTSGLMDAKCLFLTANADTYYMWAYLDLEQRAARCRNSAGHPWHHRRHVVELGLGLRLSRGRPRTRRQVPAAATRVQRRRARGWLLRAQVQNESRGVPRPSVPPG